MDSKKRQWQTADSDSENDDHDSRSESSSLFSCDSDDHHKRYKEAELTNLIDEASNDDDDYEYLPEMDIVVKDCSDSDDENGTEVPAKLFKSRL